MTSGRLTSGEAGATARSPARLAEARIGGGVQARERLKGLSLDKRPHPEAVCANGLASWKEGLLESTPGLGAVRCTG